MLVWVDGRLRPADEATVAVLDHGLTVGDGVFETTKVLGGRPFALTRHLQRLRRSAAGLGLPEPDLDLVRSAVAATIEANDPTGPLRLRVTYTGGVAPLGSERGDARPTLVVAAAPLAPWPATTRAATVPWVRNERGAVAGLKTTSYAENVVMLAAAKARGATEALMANTVGNLCEGTGSNVFLVLDGRLVTPPLSSGCLAGVTRALVLEWVGAEEVDVPFGAVHEAEEVFLTSATRDVMPVSRVDDRELSGGTGPVSSRARAVFTARSTEDDDP